MNMIVYTIDKGYLLPAAISATQVRISLNLDPTRILIICFGEVDEKVRLFRKIFESNNIEFIAAESGILDGLPMYFARFFIDKIVPTEAKNMMYLDGDTQVLDSLLPILSAPLPTNVIGAVFDPMSVLVGAQIKGHDRREHYLSLIGIDKNLHSRYFNSGVLRFDRTNWESISRDCLAFQKKLKVRLEFPDQDVLNLVAGASLTPISFRWNFPSFWINSALQSAVEPTIVHFMSQPRPWDGSFQPWGHAFYEPYAQFLNKYPELKAFCADISFYNSLKYRLQQQYKTRFLLREWRSRKVRDVVANMELGAVI